MKNFFLLLGICVFSFFFLAYRVTDVPPGVNGDEAAIGYNAILLSRTLHDESGKFLPLFITSKATDWKQPVYVYTMAGLFKIFGPSYFLLRGTSIFFIIISLVILYFLSRDYFNTRFFILAWIIFITSPIIMLLSHWGAENVAPVPFVLLWLLMMAKFEKSNKKTYMFLGGISLGVGLFTYYAARAFFPVLIFLTLFYLMLIFKKNLRKIILMFFYFVLGVAPFFLILYISKFYYPGAIVGNYRSALPSVYEFLSKYLSTFDLSFLFFKGDTTIYHSTGKYGMFLLASLPLFIIGIRKIMVSGKPFEKLVLLSLFIGPLLFGFVFDIYRASRLLSLVPFYTIIAGIGIQEILNLRKKSLRISFLVISLFLILINYYFFATDYWFVYPERVKSAFSTPIHVAFKIASDEISNKNMSLYIEEGIYKKEITAILFFKEVYFPNIQLNILQLDSIPNNSLVFANPSFLKDINKLQLKEITSQSDFYKLYIKKI